MEVLLNCAVDANGRVAGPGGAPVRLSTDDDMARVHRLRAQCDAIMVGIGTLLADDPSLRVKQAYAEGPDPIPVIMDRRLRTPPAARVMRPETRIYHETDGSIPGVTSIRLPLVTPAAVCDDLADAGITSLLVEGGPTVLRAFINAGCWDAFTVFQADVALESGPRLWDRLPRDGMLPNTHQQKTLGGTLWTFSP